jgi:hypothetical protein
MDNDSTRTVPSAVLGEYLNDVQAVWAYTKPSGFKRELKGLNDGLAPYLIAIYGKDVGYGYIRDLIKRAEAQRRTDAKAWRQELAEQRAEAQRAAEVEGKVEEPKPKRKPWQSVRLVNEHKMRVALIGAAYTANGWTKIGIRALARQAELKHRTARDVLKRMEADGQIRIDDHWGQGRWTGVQVRLEHPCWSDGKYAQLLAQSKLSSQVR